MLSTSDIVIIINIINVYLIFVPVPCVKVLNSLEFPKRGALKYLLLFNNCLSTTLEFILMRVFGKLLGNLRMKAGGKRNRP